MTLTQRVARRFLASAAVNLDQRHTEVLQEVDTLEELKYAIEEFIFMEEPAMRLEGKLRELAQKHPDLKDALRRLELGMDHFHGRVLRELSSSVDEVDEALDRRQEELEELTDQLRGR